MDPSVLAVASIVLRDGSYVRIRQARAADGELLVRGFERPSQSRVTGDATGQMMRLLERLGAMRVVDQATGTIEVVVRLPAAGVSSALRKLIRIAAARDIAIPIGQLPIRPGGWTA